MGATRRRGRAAQGHFGLTGRYYPPQSAAADAPRPHVVVDPGEAVASIRHFARRLRVPPQADVEDLLRIRKFSNPSLFHSARGPPEGLEMQLLCLLHGFPRHSPVRVIRQQETSEEEIIGFLKPTVCISLPKREHEASPQFYETEVPDSEPECDIGVSTKLKSPVRVTASSAQKHSECQDPDRQSNP